MIRAAASSMATSFRWRNPLTASIRMRRFATSMRCWWISITRRQTAASAPRCAVPAGRACQACLASASRRRLCALVERSAGRCLRTRTGRRLRNLCDACRDLRQFARRSRGQQYRLCRGQGGFAEEVRGGAQPHGGGYRYAHKRPQLAPVNRACNADRPINNGSCGGARCPCAASTFGTAWETFRRYSI